MARDNLSSDEAFWRFSLLFYPLPGVSEALIALQDREGRDVNLILLGLWLAARGHRLTPVTAAAAAAAAAPLDAVVAEVRRLRRQLRPQPDPDVQALRHRLQSLELFGERSLQRRMAAAAPLGPEAPDRTAAARANLALCLGAAAAAAEAETLRSAFADFIRRR